MGRHFLEMLLYVKKYDGHILQEMEIGYAGAAVTKKGNHVAMTL